MDSRKDPSKSKVTSSRARALANDYTRNETAESDPQEFLNFSAQSNFQHHQRQDILVQQDGDYELYDPYNKECVNYPWPKIKSQKQENPNKVNNTIQPENIIKRHSNKVTYDNYSHFHKNPQEGSAHKDVRHYPSHESPKGFSWQTKGANKPLSTQHSRMTKALDPIWYGGECTRKEAEGALRGMNQDGAFVVRKSSKGSTEHPYTLMVLKNNKIYNIKIRKLAQLFFLGSGVHNSKSFPGVREIITHHAHTPLLLIDARDHSTETHHPLCCLRICEPWKEEKDL